MHQSSPEDLDYFALLKEAKGLVADPAKPVLKLAIVADFATQQLVPLLKALAWRAGFWLEIYEADYDSIEREILDPGSGLYTFDPKFIAILVSSEKLKQRFYASTDRATLAEQTVQRFRSLWDTIRARSSATVIQTNYVLPGERLFGNYDSKVPDSLGSVFSAVNYGLACAVRGAGHVLLSDVDYTASAVGRSRWFDEKLWNLAKSLCKLEHLPVFAQNLLDPVLAAAGKCVKCVVLDLDNTLWGGVIGEDGLPGIRLGALGDGEVFVGFQKFLLELKGRGIVLAVCSKNERHNAIMPFESHPDMVLRLSDIAIFVANWNNKADNIRHIQKTLNIGLDSIAFLDDSPFERNLVREYLPDVIVPELPEDPACYTRAICALNLFETASYSETDRSRPDQYREEAQREVAKTEFSSIDDYLKSLEMKLKLERFNRFNLPRITQLGQRSNQFNLTTRRYGDAACEKLMGDPEAMPFTLSLSDRFGDYGLISTVVLRHRRDEVEIDEYHMSCRVLQRGVEKYAMNYIFEWASEKGAKRVVGRYLPTAKNAMVRDFYAGFGFVKASEGADGTATFTLGIEHYRPQTTFFAASRAL